MAAGVYRRLQRIYGCVSCEETHISHSSPDIIYAEVLATEAAAHDHRKDDQCDSEEGREQAWSSPMELTHAASRRATDQGDMPQRCTMAAHSNTQEWLIGLQRAEIPGREAKKPKDAGNVWKVEQSWQRKVCFFCR